MNYIIKVYLLVLMVLLFGCSPAPINVTINSAEQLNQDQQSKSLPVQVKIYQLRDKNAFLQAAFRELWQQDTEALGNSMLDKQEVMINPGSEINTVLTRNKDCRYIGVVAIFRKPHGNDWRVIQRINGHFSLLALTIKVNLQNNKVILSQ